MGSSALLELIIILILINNENRAFVDVPKIGSGNYA